MNEFERDCQRLHELATKQRIQHEPEFIDAYRYAYPQRLFRQDLAMRDNPVDRRFVYDRTAGLGVGRLATWTMRALMPQELKFAQIVVRKNLPNSNRLRSRLKLKLDAANDQLHDHFKFRRFYQTTWEILKDGIVGGTMCCFIDDQPGQPLDYLPIPIDEVKFTESYKGQVDCVFRDHMVTGRQMQQEGWDIPNELASQVKNDPTYAHKCTEAFIPNGRKFDHVIWYGGTQRCRIIHKGRMRFNPYVITRWERILGTPWGNSPTRSALPDIRSMNQIVRDALVFGAIVRHGCWIIKGDFGDSRYIQNFAEPGAGIHVDTHTRIEPLPMPGEFSLSFEFQDRMRQQIKNHMMDIGMPDRDKIAYMKAETAQLLKSQWESQIGEPALRLQREYLKPIAEQTAMRLMLRGELGVVDTGELPAYKRRNQAQTLERVFRMDTNAMLRMLMDRQRGRDTMRAYRAGVSTYGPEIIARVTKAEELAKDSMKDIGMAAKYIEDKPQPLEFQQRAQSLNTALAQSRTVPMR